MPKSIVITFRDDHPDFQTVCAIAEGCDQKGRQLIKALKAGSSTSTQIMIRPTERT